MGRRKHRRLTGKPVRCSAFVARFCALLALRNGDILNIPMNALSSRHPAPGENWDAIVIGSGIGGLAVAGLLSAHAAKRVLVLERHAVAGGFTHVFHRRGYEWDVGLHYVGEVDGPGGLARRAFDALTEGRLEWAPLPEVYDRAIIGGSPFDFVRGLEPFRTRLKGYFPRETDAIDRYLAAVIAARKASVPFFAAKSLPPPLAFLLGGVLRRGFLRWSDCTTAEVLDGLTRNPELKGVLLAQWGDYGLPPAQSSFAIHAMIASHYLQGASYPVGGAGRLAEAIAPVIERSGGRIVLNAEVTEILQEGGRAVGVRTRDGAEFRAPLVVSDAGARTTYERLLPPSSPGRQAALRELEGTPPSTGHLCLYVGVKHTAAELGIGGSNLWIHPGFDHDANLRRYEADRREPFPFAYLSFPSAKDPDFARRHPGRATVEVIAPIAFQAFAPWQHEPWRRRAPDYDALKREFARRLQDELVRQVPALAGKIDYAELSTPLSTRHFMNHAAGEMYGLAATPGRFRLRCCRPHTPVRNLFLTGQDVATLGIVGALAGGILTASAILRRNLTSSPAARRI